MMKEKKREELQVHIGKLLNPWVVVSWMLGIAQSAAS